MLDNSWKRLGVARTIFSDVAKKGGRSYATFGEYGYHMNIF